MNTAQQELIKEAYKNYLDQTIFYSDPTWSMPVSLIDLSTGKETIGVRQRTLEEFINGCKTNKEFSEKWGITIEERNLSLEERINLITDNKDARIIIDYCESPSDEWLEGMVNLILESRNIPTKIIILSYNNKIIESYE